MGRVRSLMPALILLIVLLLMGTSRAQTGGGSISCNNLTYLVSTTLSQNVNASACWIIIGKGVDLTLNNYNISAKVIENNGTLIFTSPAYDAESANSWYDPSSSVIDTPYLINYGTIYWQEPIINFTNFYNYGIINDTLVANGNTACVVPSPVGYPSSFSGSGGGGQSGGSGYGGIGGAARIGLIIEAGNFVNTGAIFDNGLDAGNGGVDCTTNFWAAGGNTLATGGSVGSPGQNGMTPPQKLLSFSDNLSVLDSAGGGWGQSDSAGGSGGASVEVLYGSGSGFNNIYVYGGQGINGGGTGGAGQIFLFADPNLVTDPSSGGVNSTTNFSAGGNKNSSLSGNMSLLESEVRNLTAVVLSIKAQIGNLNQSYAAFSSGIGSEYTTIEDEYSSLGGLMGSGFKNLLSQDRNASDLLTDLVNSSISTAYVLNNGTDKALKNLSSYVVGLDQPKIRFPNVSIFNSMSPFPPNTSTKPQPSLAQTIISDIVSAAMFLPNLVYSLLV